MTPKPVEVEVRGGIWAGGPSGWPSGGPGAWARSFWVTVGRSTGSIHGYGVTELPP